MRRPPIGRLVVLLFVMCLALGAIFVRLTVLQVSQAADLRNRAADQRVRTVDLPAQRGQILDRSGERLALSMPARDVYADPRYVVDPWATATRLAPELGVRTGPLVDKLTADTTFVYLARQVDLPAAERIAGMELPGIGFLEVSKRYYPAGALAGQPGERTQELDPYGLPIVGGVDVLRPPVAGASIETTIDRDLQFQAEAALEESVAQQ
ncbi:MAG: peptidoglycan D,D-transpeptidase FtsI family protein, partial [Actinomycetota bacterium]